MRDCKRGHDRNECTKAPERNYQTKQKQQMIGSIQDVEESQLHEPKRRLPPTWIESNKAGIADELKCAHRTIRRLKSKNDDHALAQPAKSGMNRKARPLRMNRIIKQNVKHRLIPIHLGITRKPRSCDVSVSLVVRCEGLLRFK